MVVPPSQTATSTAYSSLPPGRDRLRATRQPTTLLGAPSRRKARATEKRVVSFTTVVVTDRHRGSTVATDGKASSRSFARALPLALFGSLPSSPAGALLRRDRADDELALPCSHRLRHGDRRLDERAHLGALERLRRLEPDEAIQRARALQEALRVVELRARVPEEQVGAVLVGADREVALGRPSRSGNTR